MSDEITVYIDDALDYTGQAWIDKALLHQAGNLEGKSEHPEETLEKIFQTITLDHLHNVGSSEALQLSQYSDYSNQYKWYPSDTEELFNQHLENPDTRGILYKYGWADKNGKPTPVHYELNDFGFRCKKFTDKPGILFLGCSLTFGVGVRREDTWPQLVADHFDLENWNLGMPGRGLDSIALYCRLFLENLCPNIKAICVYMPPPGRKSIFMETKLKGPDVKNTAPLELAHLNGMHWRNDDYWDNPLPRPIHKDFQRNNVSEKDVFLNWMWKRENTFFNELSSVALIKTIADEKNIPLVILNSMDNIFQDNKDLGRDLLHPGINNHKELAEKFILNLDLDK